MQEIGQENYENTKKNMEAYWKMPIKDLRHYFEMLDARTAELFH